LGIATTVHQAAKPLVTQTLNTYCAFGAKKRRFQLTQVINALLLTFIFSLFACIAFEFSVCVTATTQTEIKNETIAINAAKRGNPFISFENGKQLDSLYSNIYWNLNGNNVSSYKHTAPTEAEKMLAAISKHALIDLKK